MNGTAYKTEGLLTMDDLMYNGRGRIVSKNKYKTAKKEMRLEKYGYGAKKGKFGYVKIGKKNTTLKKKSDSVPLPKKETGKEIVNERKIKSI